MHHSHTASFMCTHTTCTSCMHIEWTSSLQFQWLLVDYNKRQYSLDHAKGSISIFTFWFYCYLTLKLHQTQWKLSSFLFHTSTTKAAKSISIPFFEPMSLYFRLQCAWTIKTFFVVVQSHVFSFAFCFNSISCE